ncbi:hypothetical protein [Streptomyces sp. 6N106]|uniref:hypothetical protein n=1 Tax=Streptomyces sp. 6N106 TaxID=3457418 RepID=UPI003FD43D63
MKDDVLAPEPLPAPMRETITPAAAAQILEKTRLHACNPRKLDPAHARRLARDMSSGGWDDHNPDVLSLCEHGAALQGQHRLEAVIISQIPRSFLVARNVPHTTATIMDCGKTRSAATALSLAGVEGHRKDISSTVRLLQLYDAERKQLPWPAWRSVTYTNAEIVRFFQVSYPELPDFLPMMTALKGGLYSAPAASLACAYLVYRDGGDTPLANDFFQSLVSGAHLDVTDPRWVARRWFSNPSRPRRGNTVSPLQLGLLLKTWNLWAAGGTWEIAYFRPNERMPDIVHAPATRTGNAAGSTTTGTRRKDKLAIPVRCRATDRTPDADHGTSMLQVHLPISQERVPA